MDDSYLAHHGTRGQKWGVRNYQNSDGSLTPLGRIHYGVGEARKKLSAKTDQAKEAVKKKIKPSTEDLQEQYNRELDKNEQKRLKMAIKETKQNRSKDKYSVMTDEDINNEINRIQKELRLNDLRKQLEEANNPKKEDSPFKEALKNQVQRYATEAVGKAVGSAITKAGERLLETNSERLKREYEDIKNARNAQDLKSLKYGWNKEIETLQTKDKLNKMLEGKDPEYDSSKALATEKADLTLQLIRGNDEEKAHAKETLQMLKDLGINLNTQPQGQGKKK